MALCRVASPVPTRRPYQAVGLQPWIDRLAFQRPDGKNRFVDAAQRLAAHEAVQRFMPKRAKEVQELER
jgi:hypothetical protein